MLTTGAMKPSIGIVIGKYIGDELLLRRCDGQPGDAEDSVCHGIVSGFGKVGAIGGIDE